jgi:hypothetical protein
LSIHPITYNDYLTDSVQSTQSDRHSRKFDQLALEYCGYTSSTAPNLGKVGLLNGLKEGTKPNVEDYSASLAADVAKAYYEVFTMPHY